MTARIKQRRYAGSTHRGKLIARTCFPKAEFLMRLIAIMFADTSFGLPPSKPLYDRTWMRSVSIVEVAILFSVPSRAGRVMYE